MRCPDCNAQVEREDVFCGYCGKQFALADALVSHPAHNSLLSEQIMFNKQTHTNLDEKGTVAILYPPAQMLAGPATETPPYGAALSEEKHSVPPGNSLHKRLLIIDYTRRHIFLALMLALLLIGLLLGMLTVLQNKHIMERSYTAEIYARLILQRGHLPDQAESYFRDSEYGSAALRKGLRVHVPLRVPYALSCRLPLR